MSDKPKSRDKNRDIILVCEEVYIGPVVVRGLRLRPRENGKQT